MTENDWKVGRYRRAACDWCGKAFLGRQKGLCICRLCWTRYVRDGALYCQANDSYAKP